jgi:hypothetical protein
MAQQQGAVQLQVAGHSGRCVLRAARAARAMILRTARHSSTQGAWATTGCMRGAWTEMGHAVLTTHTHVMYTPHTSVPVFRVGPPGYFAHVSITTPVVSAWKNYYI